MLMLRGEEEEETIVLYFDSWPKEERCVSLPLKQVLHMNFYHLMDQLLFCISEKFRSISRISLLR